MSRHLVTVCVVCVLCTTHAPCLAHTDLIQQESNSETIIKVIGSVPGLEDRLQPRPIRTVSREMVEVRETKQSAEKSGDFSKKILSRRRRDINAHDAHKISEAYGDGKSMSVEEFDRLLMRLGLCHFLKEQVNEQHMETSSTPLHDDSFADGNNANSLNGSSESQAAETNNLNTRSQCLERRNLLRAFSEDGSQIFETDNASISMQLFERICRTLVYQLVKESNPNQGSFRQNRDQNQSDSIEVNTWEVWLYSSTSILVISLCGLLGVAVIPVMSKSYYHQLLQFLVALAVGTLCGDALIHLLPHAMGSHGHSHNADDHIDKMNEHKSNMLKGLVAMLGIVLFFFTEKALTMIAEWRKSRQRRNTNKLPPRIKVMREPETAADKNNVGEKLCKHKYSSYPYCYGEITTDTQDNSHDHHRNEQRKATPIEEEKPLTSDCNTVLKTRVETDASKTNQDKDWQLEQPSIEDNTKSHHTDDNDDDDHTVTIDAVNPSLNEGESYTVIIREHQTKHHGHTHSHGHVHSAPDSMSSVAWMVVMGDGLHNFTDGMAIGAAFAENIAGGFSTALAVFCHELPHELGDFAVLLKAGMSARQAVFYNLLSSILCIFGMVFGILVGRSPEASSWIFAAAAGMFIYIALVDMIPELTTSHSEEGGSKWQCILQALGLITGLGIMLIIALYEHDLQQVFVGGDK